MRAHLVNCTYCVHRCSVKNRKQDPEVELCRLTGMLIPHPSRPGRFCKEFHQEGHDCNICAPYLLIN